MCRASNAAAKKYAVPVIAETVFGAPDAIVVCPVFRRTSMTINTSDMAQDHLTVR
jgi:hypothetical protein